MIEILIFAPIVLAAWLMAVGVIMLVSAVIFTIFRK